jgi:hypothetical protein
MRRLNKKGYVFTLDLVISLIILIMGIALIFYKYASVNKTIYFTEQMSEDIIGVLAYTRITDLCTNVNDPSRCDCPNYQSIKAVVCSTSPKLMDTDANLLSMTSEMIERRAFSGDKVKEIIHEIFVTKKVIDEKRFGFAILYTSLVTAPEYPLELYNTETYGTP